jgi:phosphatidate phosphatase APP1
MLKRSAGLGSILATVGAHNQKQRDIVAILNAYPDLPFVLLGDSGQHDTKIYSEIVEMFPNRIKAVYIRDITPSEPAIEEVYIEDTAGTVPFVTAKNSVTMAHHAVERGLIQKETITKIAAV